MLDLTGLHLQVRAFVLATRGARRLIRDTARQIRGAIAVKDKVVVMEHRGPRTTPGSGAALMYASVST